MNVVLTKNTIRKLSEAKPEVALYNGCFIVAGVKIKNNKMEYEIRVERSFEKLEIFSGIRNKSTLIVWGGSTGAVYSNVPECARPIVDMLWSAADLPETEINRIRENMFAAIDNFNCQMGFSQI